MNRNLTPKQAILNVFNFKSIIINLEIDVILCRHLVVSNITKKIYFTNCHRCEVNIDSKHRVKIGSLVIDYN